MSFGGFSDIQRDRDRAHSSRHRERRFGENEEEGRDSYGGEESFDGRDRGNQGYDRNNNDGHERRGDDSGISGTYRERESGGGGGRSYGGGDDGYGNYSNREEEFGNRNQFYGNTNRRGEYDSYENSNRREEFGDRQHNREEYGGNSDSPYGSNNPRRDDSGSNLNRDKSYGNNNYGGEYGNTQQQSNSSGYGSGYGNNNSNENYSNQNQPNNYSSQTGQANPINWGAVAEAGILHFAKAYEKSSSANQESGPNNSNNRPAEQSEFAKRLANKQEAESGSTLVKQAFGGVKATIEKLTGEKK